MGVKFTLQEPGENTQRAGLRDKGLNKVCSEIFPKLTEITRDRGKALMTECVKVVELVHPMQSFPTVQPPVHTTIQILLLHILKTMTFNQSNEIYGKSTKHLHKQ
jgi:hypothetical protein